MLKFLLLIGVIAAAYYGYKYYGRWQEAQEAARQKQAEAEAEAARLRRQQAGQPPAAPAGSSNAAAEMGGEDMVACPGCGTYRPVGAKGPCETPGCPTIKA